MLEKNSAYLLSHKLCNNCCIIQPKMCYAFWWQISGCGFILSLFSFHTYMRLFVGQRLDIGQRELVDLYLYFLKSTRPPIIHDVGRCVCRLVGLSVCLSVGRSVPLLIPELFILIIVVVVVPCCNLSNIYIYYIYILYIYINPRKTCVTRVKPA